MPAFDDLTSVTVSSHAKTIDGAYATGTVTFTPSAPLLQDVVSGEAIFTFPLRATFDGTGHATIALPVTNHPDVVPLGWIYHVSVAVNGAQTRTFDLSVPFGSATFDLFKAAPVPDSGSVYLPVGSPTPVDDWNFLLLMEKV